MLSLIFQGFIGRHWSRAETFQAAFGERGCFMSLASDSAKYSPCELVANLSQEDAENKAAILREGGMQIEIVPTADVTDVKHRASECWPTHRASNGESFTEWDGIVVRGVSLGLRDRVREWRKGDASELSWGFELGYNHEHPTNTEDRHSLRMARERGAELGAALTQCFPEREFLISYRGEQVSFCQFTKELPLGISPSDLRGFDLRVPRDQKAVCFCEVCQRATPYTVRTQPDTEFPNAQFADCAICENEVILWADHDAVLAGTPCEGIFIFPKYLSTYGSAVRPRYVRHHHSRN